MAVKLSTGTPKTVSTAGTAVQLSSDARYYPSIVIQAHPGNTGYIYVGDSTVDSTNGLVIASGLSMEITGTEIGSSTTELTPSDIYIDSDEDGDGVRFSVFKRRI